MIYKSYIETNLRNLENLYNHSSGAKPPLYYSKLALLELCGWIEISMDDIVLRCAKKKLREPNNIQFVNKSIIKRIHGFEYNQYFRVMLMQVIGIIALERIEKSINTSTFSLFQSTLNNLKTARDGHAHTYIKNITIAIDAPSVTKGNFINVYNGLKAFEDKLRAGSLL